MADWSDISDDDVVGACEGREPQRSHVFGVLNALVPGMVRRQLNPTATQGDAVQEVMQNVLCALNDLLPKLIMRTVAGLRANTQTIVCRKVCDWISEKRNLRGPSLDSTASSPSGKCRRRDLLPDSGESPRAAAISAELIARGLTALEQFKPEDRELFWWRVRDKLPYAEIGRRLGIAEGTAKERFHRMLHEWRGRVGEQSR